MARYGVWSPLPQFVGGTQKWVPGRYGRRLTAVVIHRMEGYLMGTDTYFRREYNDYYPYARMNASTHFGVGYWNGQVQVRQWVDTDNTAWGWFARPSGYTPSALAQRTLTNIWSPYEDLNWQVLSVEVEGFHYQPWNLAFNPALRGLLSWMYRTHGNLVVLLHNDNSNKPCPGVYAFRQGMPGYHGNTLGNIFGGTSSTRTPIDSVVEAIYPTFTRKAPGGTVVGQAYVGERFRAKFLEKAGPEYTDWRNGSKRRDWVIFDNGLAAAKHALKTVSGTVWSTKIAYNRTMRAIGAANIRKMPGGTVIGTARVGQLFAAKWLEKNGPVYTDPRNGAKRKDWIILTGGSSIAKAFLVTN